MNLEKDETISNQMKRKEMERCVNFILNGREKKCYFI